jgi:hypothetical protein
LLAAADTEKDLGDAEGKFIADETEKWGKVVMFSGAKVD